ncbi:MAG: regulatory protein RecX [candidate division WS1 bacterium]|jgi:regulatory protein|nr:regulatory protein RecX [candidate division WS1 bacterium]
MSDRRAHHPQYAEAKSAAIRLLAQKARTRAYLTQRLRRKELDAEAVDEALSDLQRAGYVDDEQYARDRVDALLRQSKRGAQALIHTLTQEGADRDLAERIVAEALSEHEPADWALEAAGERADRLRGLPPETARRRLYGYLKRRGFGDAEIMRAVDEVLPELDE